MTIIILKGKAMGIEEKSLRVYDSKRTFFSKIGNTFTKILTPTKVGLNSILINMKRKSMIKNYKHLINCEKGKEEAFEKNFEESYSLYLQSLDELVINTIYKKVSIGTASCYEKEALANYYNVIHLKENDEIEYKYKKQKYLLELDYNLIKNSEKEKNLKEFIPTYIYEMEKLFKALLKHYSMRLTGKIDEDEKNKIYDSIFETLDNYVRNILSLKDISEDDELTKECNLYETYEVGKLDKIDIIDKDMILLGIGRKLFVHSLPMIVSERCYIRLLKRIRNILVETKLDRKKENAFQVFIRLIENYNEKVLKVKMYWDDNELKKEFNIFNENRNRLEKIRNSDGFEEYEKQKKILYIREDMNQLRKYGSKYENIIKFYKNELVKLGGMRRLPNKIRKFNDRKSFKIEGLKRVLENELKAC